MRVAAAALLVLLLAAVPGLGASSTTVVSVTVPGAISIDDQCLSDASHKLGTVLPGGTALSATGASVCRIGFTSSNSSAMLRAYQGDRAGDAMTTRGSWASQGGYTGNWDLEAVDMAGSTVIAAGENGLIRTSGDGGATWTPRTCGVCPAGTTFTGAAVARDNVLHMFLVASAGRIWFSNDGGASWVLQASGTTDDLHAVVSPTQALQFAVGVNGRVLRRRAAGAWTTVAACPGAVGQDFFTVSAPTVNDIWVGGDASCRSADGNLAGAPTFSNIVSPVAAPRISAVSGSIAWAASGPQPAQQVWYTTTGGASWTSFEAGIAPIHGVAAVNASTAYAITSHGWMLKTIDTGVTWSHQASPGAAGLTEVAASSTTQAVVAGDNDALAYTADGANWLSTRSGPATHRSAWDVDATSDQRAWTVGALGVIKATTNGGTVWNTQSSGTTRALHRVDAVDDQVVWAVGDRGTILKTTDGGTTPWVPQNSGTTRALTVVSAYDSSIAWAAGDGGTVLYTSNGGASWQARGPAVTDPIRGISAVDDRTAVFTTGMGEIWRTTNSGGSWTQVHTSTATLSIVDFANERVGYVNARWNTRLVTSDGGATWTQYGGGTNEDLDVDAVSSDVAFFGDSGGWLMATHDRGLTTSYEAPAAWGRITAIAAPDANTVWVVNEAGEIFKRSAGTASFSQYGGGSTWGGAATTSMFGVCLQDLAASALAGSWTEDGGTCTTSDADPWNALPTAPVKIARTAAAGTGTVDVVWGVRAATTQPSGTYQATVVFEAVAPDA